MIEEATNELYTLVKSTITDATILPAYPSSTPIFPCVTIEEKSNNNHSNSHDSAGNHHADCTIEISIYSNAENKVSVVKGIRKRIDALIDSNFNFNRDSSDSIPNFLDTDVYRWVMRYSYTIDSKKTIYRG